MTINWMDRITKSGRQGHNVITYDPDEYKTMATMDATPYGQFITPTLTKTAAQNAFSTICGKPNLPKPQSMFFVYFNINESYHSWAEFKRKYVSDMASALLYSNLYDGGVEKTTGGNFSQLLEDSTNTGSTSKVKSTTVKSKYLNTDIMYESDLSIVDSILLSSANNMAAFEMSKMVKGYKLPSISFDTTRINEYNRWRNIYTSNGKYSDLTMSFYDIKENPVQQFFFNYLKFVSNDFFMKGNEIWNHRAMPNTYDLHKEDNSKQLSYDENVFGLTIDSNIQFIKEINICEYFVDKVMVYTIVNPKIKSIDFGGATRSSMDSKDISVTFSVDGITNDMSDNTVLTSGSGYTGFKDKAYLRSMVNAPITDKMSNFLQTKYLKATTGKVLGDFAAALATSVNTLKKYRWNSIETQVKDTLRRYNTVKKAYKNSYETEDTAIKSIGESLKGLKGGMSSTSNENSWKLVRQTSYDPTSFICSK